MPLSSAQLGQRKKGIGSSEIAAVCGLSPWDGPLAVWLDKTGRAEPKPSDDRMDMGGELEPIICKRALKRLDLPEAIYGETRAHPDHPWALATPDWIVRKPLRLIETKSIGWRMMHHWSEDAEDDRGVPDYYNCQVQWQLLVWDVDVAHVAAWIGGRDLRVYTIQRDREVGQALLEIADTFWHKHVLADVQPPVDGTLSSDRWLQKRFGRATERKLVADADAEAIVAAFRQAKIAEREAKARSAALANQVKALMGEASALDTSYGTITWKQDRLGKVRWGDLLRSLPREQVDPFRSEPGRRLLCPKSWGTGERDDD